MSVNDEILYTPTGRSLEHKSLSVDIVHSNGVTQLDAHSYYGTMQTKATHDWFIKKNAKRPFIVERSSFAGLGKYGAKWLGDSSSTYGDM
jgi:alpha-glucosidase